MAITKVEETANDRKGTINEDGEEYKRYFIAFSDDILDDASVVLADIRLPNIGDAYPSKPDATMKEKEATLLDEANRQVWFVECMYEYNEDDTDSGSTDENPNDDKDMIPWEKPITYDMGYKDYVVPVTMAYRPGDADNEPSRVIQNSANYQFNPPASTVRSSVMIKVFVNLKYSDFDIMNALDYRNTINDSKITIAELKIPPYQGKLNKISPKIKYYTYPKTDVFYPGKTVKYWAIEYEVEYYWTRHGLYLLDMGYKDKNGKYYKDDVDNSNDQYNLDGFGEFEPNQEDGTEMYFDIYVKKSWTHLFPIRTTNDTDFLI